MRIRLSVIFLSLFVYAANSCAVCPVEEKFRTYKGEYIIKITKSRFLLEVFSRDTKVLKTCTIAYGLNPDRGSKLWAGDNRTPEGVYHVTEILSMDADRNSVAYKKLRDMNRFFFRASEGHSKYLHPDKDLGFDAYGARFFRIDYPNSEDMSGYRDALNSGLVPMNRDGSFRGPGSGIAIHGNSDPDSIGALSSSGCIRMYNNDVVDLDKYISSGTPVIIVP